ncbi:hypothetical protein, partial [Enterococcus avium]|uniref:hypothetical protein n=1 Tax=Enterococcus avium TaxID=33945 RepID=UPI00288D4AC8
LFAFIRKKKKYWQQKASPTLDIIEPFFCVISYLKKSMDNLSTVLKAFIIKLQVTLAETVKSKV